MTQATDADRLLAEESEILQQIRKARFDAARSEAQDLPLVASPILENQAAEQKAFEALLSLFQTANDGDADTQVAVLEAEAFAEEHFTPDPTKKELDHA